MLDSTGTPLVTFTRNTASNGFISPVCETFRRPNKSFNEFSLHTNSTAAWVPRVVVPARIITHWLGLNPRTSAMTE